MLISGAISARLSGGQFSTVFFAILVELKGKLKGVKKHPENGI